MSACAEVVVVTRWGVRCGDCLTVMFTTSNPRTIPGLRCGVCGGTVESLGRVERDRFVAYSDACACDARCTSARGVSCDCRCGGENHGTGRTVEIRTDCGPVPVLSAVSDKPERLERARASAEVFRSTLGRIDAFVASYARRDWKRTEHDVTRYYRLPGLRDALAVAGTEAKRVKLYARIDALFALGGAK